MQDSPETPRVSGEHAGVPDEIDLPDEDLLAMWDEARQGEPVRVLRPADVQVHSRWLRARNQTARLGYSVHASQSSTWLVVRRPVDREHDSPARSSTQRS
jgi:hypothetical protein